MLYTVFQQENSVVIDSDSPALFPQAHPGGPAHIVHVGSSEEDCRVAMNKHFKRKNIACEFKEGALTARTKNVSKVPAVETFTLYHIGKAPNILDE